MRNTILIIILIIIGVFAFSYFQKQAAIAPTVSPAPYKDKIEVYDLLPGQVLGPSPVTFEGQARGTWFFEADFPVHIVDSNGGVLGTGIAHAQGDWMTENYVEFKVEVTFSESTTETGTIEFVKDNPSGLPEFDDKYVVPIQF